LWNWSSYWYWLGLPRKSAKLACGQDHLASGKKPPLAAANHAEDQEQSGSERVRLAPHARPVTVDHWETAMATDPAGKTAAP
jgi:hypothetical protein